MLTEEPYNAFVKDMTENGFEVEAYRGRFYWMGPGVRFKDEYELQDIVRATDVTLQWDSPFVYPNASDEKWYEWANDNDEYQGRDDDGDE